jgi:hypothetical protein
MRSAGAYQMKNPLGFIIAAPFVAMAAIPIVMGAVIFAPIYIPLAVACALVENSDEKLKVR